MKPLMHRVWWLLAVTGFPCDLCAPNEAEQGGSPVAWQAAMWFLSEGSRLLLGEPTGRSAHPWVLPMGRT